MDFFFYGTLMDADVRRRVLGRDVRAGQIEAAELPGYRTVFLARASYPGVIDAPGSVAPGLLVRGLRPADAARLAAFEGTQYHNRALTVTARRAGAAKAHVFVPKAGVAFRDRAWTLDAWQRRFKTRFLSVHPFRPT